MKNEFLFDKRIVQRNVALGLVDQKVVDKTLTSLADRADNATTTTIDATDDGIDDIDDGADSDE